MNLSQVWQVLMFLLFSLHRMTDMRLLLFKLSQEFGILNILCLKIFGYWKVYSYLCSFLKIKKYWVGGLSLISQFSEITFINFAFFLSTLIDVSLHVDDVLFRRELSHASQGDIRSRRKDVHSSWWETLKERSPGSMPEESKYLRHHFGKQQASEHIEKEL